MSIYRRLNLRLLVQAGIGLGLLHWANMSNISLTSTTYIWSQLFYAMVSKHFSFFIYLLFYNNENLFFPPPTMETLYIRFLVILFLGEANMPSWLKARKHFVGWKPGSSIEDMCLWIFKGTSCVSLSYSLCCQFRGDRKGWGDHLRGCLDF